MELFFLELLLRGAALCLLTALVLWLLTRAAATYRHLLCGVALASMLLLPFMRTLLPPLPLLQTPVALPAPAPEPPAAPAAPVTATQETPAPVPAPVVTQPGPVVMRTLPLLPALWALGVLALSFRLLLALLRLRTLARQSRPATVQGVPVLVSETVTTPLTWGILRPQILLPASLVSGDPAVCTSVLRHEQAHIQRRDWLWHLVWETVCVLCWFQPGVWWLRTRLRAESERACDEAVLLSGVKGVDYAAHLVAVLRSAKGSEMAPGMANRGAVEARIRHILDTVPPRRPQAARLGLTALLGLALLPLAALRVTAQPSLRGPSPMPISPQPPATASIERNEERSAFPLAQVVWGKAVEGIEPGFLLLTNAHVAPDLKLLYQVLLRNTTDKPIAFYMRLLQYDGYEKPYLEDATAKAYPAKGSPRLYPSDLLHDVTLLPGESVIVPGQYIKDHHDEENLALYLGKGDSGGNPRIASFPEGRLKVVQPVTVYRALDRSVLFDLIPDIIPTLTKVAPDGTTFADETRVVIHEETERNKGGQTLHAETSLDVGTLNNEVARKVGAAVWGKADVGIQCGIRLVTPHRTFRAGDTLEAEILWRNGSGRTATWVPQRGVAFHPVLRTAGGQEIRLGVRPVIPPPWYTYAPNEVRSLGVVQVKLASEGTLPPGKYYLSGWGGVNNPGDPYPRSGEIEVTVTAD